MAQENAVNNINNEKKVSLLTKKVSNLRFFVYTLVASLVLITCVIVGWSYFTIEPPFETYFSVAPKEPKAYLYLSPQEATYQLGEEFPVDIFVNTVGSNVVVVAAYLSYNTKYLEALSVDLTDSAFEFTAEKEINQKEGKIKITVGKPTPGIKTNRGKVATVYFKAKEKIRPYMENIYFNFTKGSNLFSTVILDDKKGTNILQDVRGAKINIE